MKENMVLLNSLPNTWLSLEIFIQHFMFLNCCKSEIIQFCEEICKQVSMTLIVGIFFFKTESKAVMQLLFNLGF